ncbi:peptide deformylase [Streptomyces ipomoeae]|uniref:Peptide deformylase n=1 Tax=Streptomyces ipomoeae 91-03 TaxID=698759 RepID=L1KH60_9ACTN|nr:peptide deformylase [Streptomyces ipomoeae]EKX60151.1 peptide deformylase [Streptomyces ipomoeae 91-03]MDX2697045.1 peptide deformylase [Streptomyces ipomoeae]MDX2820708.1 peptide deformylase [Streptomyces ipomoeae]MDX2842829.1 peptide deformylase [Streptomyces ipomoeae]MDX2873215.1 peptide deformylase [Streptomyces ipomoeae]
MSAERDRAESRPLSDRVEELLAHEGPLPIVAAGDPVLRRTAEPFDGQLDPALLARFIAALRATMHAAPGVGLAAPQVGVSLRIAVVEDPAPVPEEVRLARGRVPQPFRVLVNPSYEAVGPYRDAFFEGCLSVPGWQAVVARHAKVRLRALDEHGQAVDEEFSGWPARIVQHETDHLNGTLYLDRAELRSLSSNQAMAERWNDPTPARAARDLGFLLPE